MAFLIRNTLGIKINSLESGLYYMSGRYYSPLIKQFISALSPETALANAGTIYGLNLYLLTNSNPVNMIYNGYTIETSIPLSWDPDRLTKLQYFFGVTLPTFFGTPLGKVTAVFLFLYAFELSVILDSIALFIGAMATTGAFLVIGGLAAGFRSERNGNDFFKGFVNYINKNWAQSVAISSALFIISASISSFVKAIKPQCFISGTKVITSTGNKNIEDIEVGDKVWAYNDETGKKELKEVVRLFRNESSMKTTLSIKADDGIIDEIVSTPGHKYYLPENQINRNPNEILEHASYDGLNEKWVSAGLLTKGDKVLLSDGKYAIIVSVKTEQCESFGTYNFEVEDFHTYYVGENGICVHNAGPCHLDPSDIRYTQNNGGRLFTDGAHAGESVDDLIGALKAGKITPDDIPPLEVFKARGEIWSINNRRLYAYKMAGVDSVPVKWVSRSSMGHRWTGDGINFYLRR